MSSHVQPSPRFCRCVYHVPCAPGAAAALMAAKDEVTRLTESLAETQQQTTAYLTEITQSHGRIAALSTQYAEADRERIALLQVQTLAEKNQVRRS
jgi:hypothetical protein